MFGDIQQSTKHITGAGKGNELIIGASGKYDVI
jgi:hypothetical protein